MTRADYEACQARDEQGFRVAVEALTRRSLEAGIAGFDYKAVVSDEWRRGNLDDVIDRQVDQAIGELRDESSWMQLWQTLASQEKARELATTAAERVYRSDAMKKALEGVATGIGKEIGKRIELATVDTAGPATQCVQAFLGPRYGATIARIVATGTGREYGVDPAKGSAQVVHRPGDRRRHRCARRHGRAGGAQAARQHGLAHRPARGRLDPGRLVSVVAGGVGLVLIAKDIWDFRHGVLPIIGTEMKSKETKDKVREELAKSVSEQIGDSIKEISDKTADRVVEIWLEFRRAHAKVVELADRVEAFKRFLDTVKPDDLAQARRGRRAGAGQRGRGRHHPAPRQRHAASSPSADCRPAPSRSPARRNRWRRRCSGRPSPATASARSSSSRSIGRPSPTPSPRRACSGCWPAGPGCRDPPCGPAAGRARCAVRAASQRAEGAGAHPRRDPARQPVALSDRIGQVLGAAGAAGGRADPARMAELGKPSVRDAILSSSDQAAALGMMLQASSVPDPTVLLAHAQLVLDGRVSPLLLWEKHAVWLSAAAVLSLVLLMMLKRLVFGTRPRIIVQEGYGRGRGGRG